jgi:hypothetical protein
VYSLWATVVSPSKISSTMLYTIEIFCQEENFEGSVLILVSEVEPAKRNGVPYAAGNNYKDTATF